MRISKGVSFWSLLQLEPGTSIFPGKLGILLPVGAQRAFGWYQKENMKVQRAGIYRKLAKEPTQTPRSRLSSLFPTALWNQWTAPVKLASHQKAQRANSDKHSSSHIDIGTSAALRATSIPAFTASEVVIFAPQWHVQISSNIFGYDTAWCCVIL